MLRRPAQLGVIFQQQQDRQLPAATSQLLQLCQLLYQHGFSLKIASSQSWNTVNKSCNASLV